METTQKTHWKKHIDPRYISGDDLKYNLHGLYDNTVVRIVAHSDVPTFDQKLQTEVYKTGLVLQDMNGVTLPKKLIVNVENGKVLKGIFKSDFVEDWISKNTPFTIYAKADKRHGWVARVKPHYAAPQQSAPEQPKIDPSKIAEACADLDSAESMVALESVWLSLDKLVQRNPEVINAKDQRKAELKKGGSNEQAA
jgi:hypothetical protein